MTPRQPINRKPSSGKHVTPPVTLPKAPWEAETDSETEIDERPDMTHARHQVEHSRNRAGKLRKEIVDALRDPIAVHLNMLQGAIAKPSLANIIHLYPEIADMIRAAYLAGFNASGEGYNGEWPFHDSGISPDSDEVWSEGREEALGALYQRYFRGQG